MISKGKTVAIVASRKSLFLCSLVYSACRFSVTFSTINFGQHLKYFYVSFKIAFQQVNIYGSITRSTVNSTLCNSQQSTIH